MKPPALPLALAGIGGYLAWFGVHYWGSDTKWPTDPLKDVLQGKGIPAPSGQTSAASVATSIETTASITGQTLPGAAGTAAAVKGTYSSLELQALWSSQGGAQNTSFEAAQIALAESSGNPLATSSNPDGGTNVGLWQLDTKGVGAGYTVAQLQDPATNARITIMHTANGTSWAQWADAVVSNGVYTGPKV
jgi:predicted dienelactone hydrolase